MTKSKIHEKYGERKKQDPKLVAIENGDLNGAADEFADTMGGSRIEQEGIIDEEFLEIERTQTGYEAHVLEEHKDLKGNVKKVYTEEKLPESELGEAVKFLEVGESVKVHLIGNGASDLAKKRAPYIHSMPFGQETKDKCLRKVVAKNQYGIHARPATLLTKEASRYDCDVYATYDGKRISAKSIMGWMTLGAGYGSEIVLSIENDEDHEARECLDGLESLFNAKFDEE